MVQIITTHGFSLHSLRKLEKQTKSGRMRVRLMVVRLVWEGYPATAVADIMGITGETVSSDVASGNRGGPGALIPGKSPGKPSKIPPEIVEQLGTGLPQLPQAAGYGESANIHPRIAQGVGTPLFRNLRNHEQNHRCFWRLSYRYTKHLQKTARLRYILLLRSGVGRTRCGDLRLLPIGMSRRFHAGDQ